MKELISIGLVAAGIVALIACGSPSDVAVRPVDTPAGASTSGDEQPADYSKGVKVPIPAAGYISAAQQASPTTPPVEGPPTPTPPPFTFSEKTTAVLIDTLESSPRVSARQIVNEYRDDPAAANLRYGGKHVVMQGTVKEAGRDRDGHPYLLFTAGRGTLKCNFEVISEAELLRLTPGGTNAAVGNVESFDADDLSVVANQCTLVLGY